MQYAIEAMSSGAAMPSPDRNPAASSKSAPGVRMVMARVRVAPPAVIRISKGSSVARSSRRSRAAPPETSRTRTRVVGPGRTCPAEVLT